MFLKITLYFFLYACYLTANIELLPHQQKPIDYLVKNPQIKGLLVNHYMGTGKTPLAIGAAEELTEKEEVIILGPRFLKAHWQEHIRLFGVKNPQRYTFISYQEAPEKLYEKDFSNTFLILDEVHNLTQFIRSPSPKISEVYSHLYLSLRKSKRILALSGTPMVDEYALPYLINLVAGKDLLPFNEETFRIEYTHIKPIRSFIRGYLSESEIAKFFIPYSATLFALPLALFAPAGVAFAAVLGFPLLATLMFPVFNSWIMPLEKHPLRKLHVDKLKPVISQYVSYYKPIHEDLSDFPTKEVHLKKIAYNESQFIFFLNFAEQTLNQEALKRLYADLDENLKEDYIQLNSTLLQKRLHNLVGSGREIGNFEYKDKEKLIESPKFEAVLKSMLSKGSFEQTVLYSNYIQNGIFLFAHFLDRKGYKDQYEILTPELPPHQFASIIERYNQGKLPILVLHPEITEGISLKGTRQFHLLDTALNTFILDQIIARAVRYQSHKHLPKEQQKVDIYLWTSVLPSNLTAAYLKKSHWIKSYGELSDWSQYGSGQAQIDPHFQKKKLSPDEATYLSLLATNQNILDLLSIMQKNSIEVQ